MLRALLGDRVVVAVAVLVAAASLAIGLGNLLAAPGSALHAPTYVVSLVGKYLTYAILALGIDLVWGYAGILSLGHGVFFGLGGYAMGMHLMRLIGPRGVYGHPVLPDFMVFLNWKELPWYWHGFEHFGFAMLMVMLVPGLLAFVFGWLAFRARVSGVYLSIITQALTFATMLAFFRNDMGFGGNNGLTDFRELLGFSLRSDGMRVALLFGKVLIAVRDAEARVRFLGYRPEHYKLVALVVSAVMSGVGGALYVPQVGIINPSEFAPTNSIEAVIWVAVGGRGTLAGAVVGAVAVNLAKTWFTSNMPELWLFALGGLFILVTLLLPRGIVGSLDRLPIRRRAIARPASAEGRA
jgi:urea transport system permease protein